MDACCGTGRLAARLSEKGFHVSGFDLDEELLMLGRIRHPEIETFASDFRQVVDYYPQIVANPPFESKDSIEFLQWLASVQEAGDHALLVVPKGFFDKDRPKVFVELATDSKSCIENARRCLSNVPISTMKSWYCA